MFQKRLLIIADERQVVDELLDYFESHGYETEIALNSKVVINIIAEREMDLILIGYNVQETTSIDIIKEIRSINSAIPIIVIEGEKSKRIENKFIKAGVQRYLTSPLEKETLLKAVREISR